MSYTPANAVKDLQLGNGLWEQTLYNSRLQVEKIRLGTTRGGIDRLNLTYAYGTTNNNGNVLSQVITVPTVGNTAGFTLTQSYTYDSLNRLAAAQEMNGTTQLWKQSYGYDRYGNRTIDTGLDQQSQKKTSDNLKPALLSDNPTLSTINNRININQGYGYEGAGNLVSVPNRTDPSKSYRYEYDAENRQISFDRDPIATPTTKDASYVYDGDGRRVMKVADGVTTIFVYDIAGKLVAEYSSTGSSGGGTTYVTSDMLGTPRVITGSNLNDASGGVKARHDYLPFGEELFVGRSSYTGDNVRQKFTGYERDTETGLDFAQARYYANTQGRFTSVDPLLASGKPDIPQSWNRYTYCLNSPLLYIDPEGLKWYKPKGAGDTGFNPVWYDDNPGDAFEEYTKYTYWGGEENGWVALDPFSKKFKTGFESEVWAQGYVSARAAKFDPPSNVSVLDSTLEMSAYLSGGGAIVRGLGALGTRLAAKVFASEAVETGTSVTSGLAMDGLAYERRQLLKHIEGTPQAAKQLAREGEAHVFNNLSTLSRVESEIFSRGTYTGMRGGFGRWGLMFDRPIGVRIASDGSRIPLYYGQLKLKDGLYHIIPRTGPR